MKDKNKFDNYIREELEKTYSAPDNINKSLILNNRNKKKLDLTNLIFFIILILQSVSIILMGIVFVSDIFIKLISVGLGILLFNMSLAIYIIIINKESVLI